MRENIEKIPPLYFSSCENCSECCEGKFFLAPLVLEDFDKVRDYFEIRAVVLNNEIIPVILLTDGEGGSCPYLENGKCSIYNRRPPACKIYPFSPFYDDIFIDISCKGVSSNSGEKLPSNREEFIKSPFFKVDKFIFGKFVVKVSKSTSNHSSTKKRGKNSSKRKEALASFCHFYIL